MSAEARLAERVAAAARESPDVVDLSAGAFGTVHTVLPGDVVSGVSLSASRVEVGVVVRWGRPLPDVAADVRATVAAVVPDRAVDVTIEDVVVETPTAPEASGAPGRARS
ncbi:Asp23/Gls24 family envelope stress response protein [Spiractinospora alimapuensis]|uniref:hypothetical protein n=1 Tax=Spiractinospora alimapuensis TaxID=2820884 RepID=UPI002ED09461